MVDPSTQQTYANHRRFVPWFHVFVFGVLAANVLVSIAGLWRTPGFFSAWNVLLALALVVLFFYVRIFPLKAQDRVIRLEERLRMEKLLPSQLQGRIGELRPSQIIALRFASDEELAQLVEETLAGDLAGEEIKKRIKHWRPDTFRV